MITAALVSGFFGALLSPLLVRRLPRQAGWLLAALPAGLTLYFVQSIRPVAAGLYPSAQFHWVPLLGMDFTLRADGLGLFMALLISGVGTLVVIYSAGYLKGHAALGAFYGWLLAFMASMLGVVLADNLLLLFVFWELTSVCSFMLIGFDHDDEHARSAALQALLVTAGGGLALLAGFVLLGMAAGTYELSALAAERARIHASPMYTPALVLIAIGAFAKSAQFPFHFWLPNAMVAPTPVSAYLHSATMVKAGVYLLARLSPVLAGGTIWTPLVGGVGALTMLLGGALALAQADLKRLLAYSTVSALGLLTMLIGLGGEHALEATIVFLLAHALYKGALFLVAGAVEHETGTRQVQQLGGLAGRMPWTAAAAGLAALSMAGLPPLVGFISKELVYEAALKVGWLLAALTALTLSLAVCVSAVVGVLPFWRRPPSLSERGHEAPPTMTAGPLILAGLGVMLGLNPGLVSRSLLGPAISATSGEPISLSLSLWHGFTPALALSATTVILGLALFLGWDSARQGLQRALPAWGAERAYLAGLDALNTIARLQTRLLQSGYLRYYLLIIVLTTTAVGGFTFVYRGGLSWPVVSLEMRFYEIGLAALILLATLAVVVSPSRLGAVAALGTVGYGVALTYLLFGAPDLAMTQFLIESLTVILFVLAFYHLPRFAQLSPARSRARDALVAALAGGLMTTLVLSALGAHLSPSISHYFVETAVPLAHGRNVVNVILVDFRALDTLGEITVLSIAGIGVFALLKMRSEKQP